MTNEARPTTDASAARAPVHHTVSKDSIRETIESIAIAFVLAFLFRTFEAEAFVIPTGSMAPTLLGQHKDATCTKCGYQFPVSASDEESHPKEIVGCTCPNCRYSMAFDPAGPDGPVPGTFKGDRIIVSKFPFEIGAPRRWDVAVFKFPLRANTNYIKRIVGLPQETLRIHHGDILTKPEGAVAFEIERKPPSKVEAMLQVVYDHDYEFDEIIQRGWPSRWQPVDAKGQPIDAKPGDGSWQPGEPRKSFVADAAAAETWLRYKHFAPTQSAWNELSRGPLSDSQRKVRPRFITDFYAYNTGIEVSKASYEDARKYGQRLYQQRGMFDTFGLHWVGDLALDCEVKTLAGGGELVLELIEGGRSFHCQFDLTSGAATLSAEGLDDWHPQAPTSLKATGTHKVRFANVDDKLFLWIDGKLVKFDQPTSYTLEWQPPTDRDREPAAIGARKAHVQVRHLRLLRDIYYIADKARNPPSPGPVSDYDGMPMVDEENLPAFDDSGRKPFPKLRAVDFDLAADQFLMLGDNSPRSSDSRLWPTDHYVERELLVGKAMFIYWPDALDHVPGTNIWFPFFPNFGRMRFIR